MSLLVIILLRQTPKNRNSPKQDDFQVEALAGLLSCMDCARKCCRSSGPTSQLFMPREWLQCIFWEAPPIKKTDVTWHLLQKQHKSCKTKTPICWIFRHGGNCPCQKHAPWSTLLHSFHGRNETSKRLVASRFWTIGPSSDPKIPTPLPCWNNTASLIHPHLKHIAAKTSISSDFSMLQTTFPPLPVSHYLLYDFITWIQQ